jgi:hypothetical protein
MRVTSARAFCCLPSQKGARNLGGDTARKVPGVLLSKVTYDCARWKDLTLRSLKIVLSQVTGERRSANHDSTVQESWQPRAGRTGETHRQGHQRQSLSLLRECQISCGRHKLHEKQRKFVLF